MKIIIAREINGVHYTFQIEEDKDIDALFNASLYAAMPTQCGMCHSNNVHLSGNKAQGYQFVKMICDDCNARAQLGQYKDGGMFWKSWEKYEAPNTPAPTDERPALRPTTNPNDGSALKVPANPHAIPLERSNVEDISDISMGDDIPF